MESSDADQVPNTPENNTHHEANPPESQGDITSVEKAQPSSPVDFPEGGLQAWTVAISASCILLCTLGYVNSFGLVTSAIDDQERRFSNRSKVSSRPTTKRLSSSQRVRRRYPGLDLYNRSACLWVFFLVDHSLTDMEQRCELFPRICNFCVSTLLLTPCHE